MPVFATPEPITATIDASAADVRIAASDRDDTVVEILPVDPHDRDDVAAVKKTQVEFSDGALLVKGPKYYTKLFGKGGSIVVTVELPSGSRIRGTTAMGDFRATGSLGDCRFKTSMGNLHLERTTRLEAVTALGDVTVEHASDHAELSTGTGDLRIREIDGSAVLKNSSGETRIGTVTGDLRVNSANGDILVDVAHTAVNAKTAAGDVRIGEVIRDSVVLETAVGEIEVGIREGSAAWLTLNSLTGRVHNSLTAADGPGQTDETVEVRARSYTGDIVVRRA
ncbi:DUF4097 family beta strand repeat-containing protein [Amycolatopsis sp., V23-08]|uniref:DUF4097 family beta strand repeat-containing protein n=1 Tax=Amycolatopsis heterodermiae TaxID=3110235 RepID=A0ABU5RMP6_9PSEU|nr:DUF4097 family beta strand repeat-containing protein [Amycolatopsis sp., V23-08]MEA5366381.1 DUF4097 family beta strand repeat-containing protein [Amycolatopsis sp., V23-08]